MYYSDSIRPAFLQPSDLDLLLSLGWYRMNQFLFTTTHIELGDVYRVHWLRYPVAGIGQHRSHKKIRKKNSRFTHTIEPFNGISPAHAALYEKYYASIDFDGATSISDCLFGESGTGQNIFNTWCLSVYEGPRLIAAGYFDLGKETAASILHFYDPEYAAFSPGKFLILLTIDFLAQQGYAYYYPGYVVEGLSKMDYKLFLGRGQAEYFYPYTASWKPFHDNILVKRE